MPRPVGGVIHSTRRTRVWLTLAYAPVPLEMLVLLDEGRTHERKNEVTKPPTNTYSRLAALIPITG